MKKRRIKIDIQKTFKGRIFIGTLKDVKESMEEEITDRMHNTSKVYNTLSNTFIGKKGVDIIFRSTLIYSNERGILTKAIKSKNQPST